MHNRKSHEYFLKVPITTSSQELQWKESHLPVTESFSISWLRLVALPLLSTFFFFGSWLFQIPHFYPIKNLSVFHAR